MPGSTSTGSARWRASCWPDFYGTTTSALHHGLATDRLLVRWELDTPRVARRAAGAMPSPPPAATPALNEVTERRGVLVSSAPDLELDAPELLLEIPEDWDAVCRADPRSPASGRTSCASPSRPSSPAATAAVDCVAGRDGERPRARYVLRAHSLLADGGGQRRVGRPLAPRAGVERAAQPRPVKGQEVVAGVDAGAAVDDRLLAGARRAPRSAAAARPAGGAPARGRRSGCPSTGRSSPPGRGPPGGRSARPRPGSARPPARRGRGDGGGRTGSPPCRRRSPAAAGR